MRGSKSSLEKHKKIKVFNVVSSRQNVNYLTNGEFIQNELDKAYGDLSDISPEKKILAPGTILSEANSSQL